jgi:hypothetical protein
MSGSFLAIALIAAVMIVFWRLTLLVLVALLIAMLISGFVWVSGATSGATSSRPPVSVTVPAGPNPVQMRQPG